MKSLFLSIIILFSSFLISYSINNKLIYLEVKKKEGQSINKYLMNSHQTKKETPTLGGIGIIISLLITSLITYKSYLNIKYLCAIIIIISFFFIGLVDDLLKIKKGYQGLSPLIRILLEILISLVIYLIFTDVFIIDESFHLTKLYKLELGNLFILGFVFLIVGSSNAMNLTDGLDSLSGGISLIMLIPFLLLAFFNKEQDFIFLIIQLFGAILGFLTLNIHPAKIFMGDSGSLPIGAIIGYLAFILRCEFLLLIIGGLLILETFSVIIQVTSYKLFKRRVFLMTPFHHHLELKGKEEMSIVIIFYIVTITLVLISICLELFI